MATGLTAEQIAGLDGFAAARLPGKGAAQRGEWARLLEGLVPRELLEAWVDAAPRDPGERGDRADRAEGRAEDRPGRWFAEQRRAARGIFPTPKPLAAAMAELVGADGADGVGGPTRVVDPAAGDGRLLAEVARRQPDAAVLAVEREPALALAAAVSIAAVRLEQGRRPGEATGDRVIRGDGLERAPDWLAEEAFGLPTAVVMNPPYVGEKGNRVLFRRIAETHPDLEERMGPRGDLAYLFLHRALDWLAPGGRLVALTSSYWLTATGAAGLREALAARTRPKLLLRAPDLRLFDDAPGHHSLLSVFERVADGDGGVGEPLAVTLNDEPEDWATLVGALSDRPGLDVVHPAPAAFSGPRWTPFAGADLQDWARRLREEGTPLGELLEDRQGFVSGADRLSTRRYNTLEEPPEDLEVGDPLFLWETDELPERLKAVRGTVLRPVLRGSELEAGRVIVEAPADCWVLYLDDVLREDQLELVEHLEPVRAALERRREVRRGSMPWYRLHWPRSRAQQTGPKLVVPRRAREPCFALDLSGSAVSSDCTYLVAPEGVERPVAYLKTMMAALNRPAVGAYLRHFGKTKGEMIEFYSDPLRALPLPLEFVNGELQTLER